MRAAQDPDSMALTTFASATSSGRWIWQENKKNQGSKRNPFLVRSRLYCRGRLTLFAFDASLLSAMLRNMLLATAEEANAAAAATVSGLCWAGWLAVGTIKTLSSRSLQYITSYTLDYNASLDLCTVLS